MITTGNQGQQSEWYWYECLPIDFYLDCLPTISEAVAIRAASSDDHSDESSRMMVDFMCAFSVVSRRWGTWLRREPFVFWIPDTAGFCVKYGFVFKTDNNGDTIIVSPVDLSSSLLSEGVTSHGVCKNGGDNLADATAMSCSRGITLAYTRLARCGGG